MSTLNAIFEKMMRKLVECIKSHSISRNKWVEDNDA